MSAPPLPYDGPPGARGRTPALPYPPDGAAKITTSPRAVDARAEEQAPSANPLGLPI